MILSRWDYMILRYTMIELFEIAEDDPSAIQCDHLTTTIKAFKKMYNYDGMP